ncbi:MAG: TRAP transporter small permease [Pigmentiphaga sp.]|uniref:TRAP transporter small permease n=1 Tax=Pigmentiphaga sp. TaxID=1977564 RepID=UPI0029A0D60F|nr:TRAP transporter small permease [Pigmentiphaga sp.]MDX3906171.1 TRAP transporter small permease [Pigmentiphaga sp.]
MKLCIDRLLLGLHVAGACLVAALTLIIVYDVSGRLLFNRPFAGTAELVGVGLVLLTFLQTPYVIRQRKLLRVTFLLDLLPAMVRSWLNAFTYLLGAAFFIAMAVASWEPAWNGWATDEFFGNDAFRIAAWPLRFGTLALWIVAALVCLLYAIDGVRGRMRDKDDQLPE